MQLMTNRDARASMEKDGLRVAQDLTRRQSAQLRSLREEGKVGYFSKGRLHIRESDTAPTDRQRHRGNRRQDTSAHSTSAPRNPPSVTLVATGCVIFSLRLRVSFFILRTILQVFSRKCFIAFSSWSFIDFH